MATIDEKPGLAERYSSALESTHLEVNPDERGAIDYVIAAGLVRDSLGPSLLRLRSEWDAIGREHRMGSAHIQALVSTSWEWRRAGRHEDADALQRHIEAQALTARALTLIHLKTLSAARQAIGDYAERQAYIRRFMRPRGIIASIAGRALESWLDPNCRHCEGRGQSGGFGTPVILCTTCHGSGRRHVRLGKTNDEHEFGRMLLCKMDSATDRAGRLMRRFVAGQ